MKTHEDYTHRQYQPPMGVSPLGVLLIVVLYDIAKLVLGRVFA